MNVPIGKRLKLLRNMLKLTQTELGINIGKKLSTIQQYEAGSRSIDETTKLLIHLQFNVNKEWLETGKGEMFDTYDNTNNAPIAVYSTCVDEVTYRGALILDFLAPEYKAKKDDIFLVSINDNSMYPLLYKNDLVACIKNSSIVNGIHACKIANEIMLRKLSVNKNIVELIPENPEFKKITCNKSECYIMGRVIWFGRNL